MTRMLVAATAASVLAAGTGLSAGASLRPPAPDRTARSALFTTVNVTEKEYKITVSKKSAKRGLVIFKVKNVGALQHGFQIKGRKTQLISPGKSATLRVTFLKKGHYPYRCFVTGHAALGMKGVFTIT
jgi:uncharacterized cupredoxin-like copper-binding protein